MTVSIYFKSQIKASCAVDSFSNRLSMPYYKIQLNPFKVYNPIPGHTKFANATIYLY